MLPLIGPQFLLVNQPPNWLVFPGDWGSTFSAAACLLWSLIACLLSIAHKAFVFRFPLHRKFSGSNLLPRYRFSAPCHSLAVPLHQTTSTLYILTSTPCSSPQHPNARGWWPGGKSAPLPRVRSGFESRSTRVPFTTTSSSLPLVPC